MKTPEKDTTQKNVLVILGMARSGTSAIARGVKALGIDLGDKFKAPSDRWNPKGFFEDTDIVYKINRGVLYALDYPWMSTTLIDELQAHQGALQDFKKSAVSLIRQRMATSQYWGFKDPRTAKILPFWQAVFADLNLKDSYVIALRNPLASAYSYQSLSGCDLEEALLLWLMHVVPAVDGTMGKNRVVVSYELLMQDPHLQLNRIRIGLDIPDLADTSEIDTYADEFLDKKLRHFDCSSDELKSHPAAMVAPLCVRVYNLLLLLAKDEMKFDDAEFITQWREIKDELAKVYPMYHYINTLLKRNKHLERKLRTTHKSILWKMLYPLRLIDDALRARRRKAREKRRFIKAYE